MKQVVVAVAVSRSFLSKRKRFGPSLFREKLPMLDRLCIPSPSFEGKVKSSFLSKGVTWARSRRGWEGGFTFEIIKLVEEEVDDLVRVNRCRRVRNCY